jgi:DNA-binding CsgD family transcriptional regulator
MQLIHIDAAARAPSPGTHATGGEAALAGLIGSLSSERFAHEGLAQLNRWLPACWWSVYQLFHDGPPHLHLNAAFNGEDGSDDAWQVYRRSLYRVDETFDAARDHLQAEGRPMVLTHWHADEMPRRHRAAIYQRHALRERLSLVAPADGGALLALNLYRHAQQPTFGDDEIDAVRRLARPLLAVAEQHIALNARLRPEAPLLAALPRREREVCERLLKGWSHDGIAADLGLSPVTVKTYRDRAFERLGIHHRSELFALALKTAG